MLVLPDAAGEDLQDQVEGKKSGCEACKFKRWENNKLRGHPVRESHYKPRWTFKKTKTDKWHYYQCRVINR